MTRAAPIALLCAVAACGGDERQRTETVRVDVARGERLVVAEVNGRPVFGDCVAAQAEGHGLDRRAALQECIDFELLAQEAEARGYGGHPEVRRVQRREAARQLIRSDFEATHDGPEDVPMEFVRKVWGNPALRSAYDHPEYRFCYYARAPLKPAQRGTPEAAEAEAAIRRLHRDLAGRKLTRAEFAEVVERHREKYPFELTTTPYNTPRTGKSGENFARALFDIPEPGYVSAPTLTRWGWDIILLTKISPERRDTVEQAADAIRKRVFEPWREQDFLRWVRGLSDGYAVEVAENWTQLLPEDPLDLSAP